MAKNLKALNYYRTIESNSQPILESLSALTSCERQGISVCVSGKEITNEINDEPNRCSPYALIMFVH